MTHWSRDYLGLPYAPRGRTRAGVDCWGLPLLVFADRLGIALPSYGCDGVSEEEARELAALIDGEPSPLWRAVADGEEREFDLALFEGLEGGGAPHIGIVMRPGLMLHAYRGAQVVTPQDYRSGYWPKVLAGFYRHVELLDEA